MNDFEKWFMVQEFYTNMRFIHGDALFIKDGFVYRVLPVQMTYVAWVEKQSEIDQLKAKNTALVHAVVTANAEKTKWAHSYWEGVERNAEYGAMLISNPDSLEFSCFKKEKEIEKLKAEKEHLAEMNKRYIGKMQEQQDMIAELKDRVATYKIETYESYGRINYAHHCFTSMSRDHFYKIIEEIICGRLRHPDFSFDKTRIKTLRGEHE